ncbi:MAG: alpha/beta fold hydrolase [Spirillospora sp.]
MVMRQEGLGVHRIRTRDGLSALLRQAESPPAAAVLLVHPANLRGSVWLPVIARLPAAWACAAIDLPGHGDSPRHDAYSVESWSDACLRLIDHLGWPSVHLVGASVGAPIAADLATKNPGRVSGLTTVGGACLPASAAQTRAFLAELAELGAPALLEGMVAAELGAGGTGPVADGTGSGSGSVAEISDNPSAQVACIWRAAAEANAMSHAGRIGCPVLAIVGERDESCPPEDSRAFAEAAHGRLEVLPGQGHLPMSSAPAAVASLIHRHVLCGAQRGDARRREKQ